MEVREMQEKEVLGMEWIRKILSKATKVVVENREHECLWRNFDGGAYGFWTTYERTDEGWAAKYYTTSYLDYCKMYGYFKTCEDCPEYDHDKEICTARPFIITTEELLEEIEEAMNNPFMGVEIYDDGDILYEKKAEIGCRECRCGLH